MKLLLNIYCHGEVMHGNVFFLFLLENVYWLTCKLQYVFLWSNKKKKKKRLTLVINSDSKVLIRKNIFNYALFIWRPDII